MLTRWSDFDRAWGPMDLFRDRMNRLFSDFDRSYAYSPEWTFEKGVPRTNLYDHGERFEILAEVPGFSKDDLNVKIQGNYLEISGTRKSDAPKDYTAHRLERQTATFSRSFTLPSDVDSEKVEASLTDGILSLTLPKAEAAKPKQITIG